VHFGIVNTDTRQPARSGDAQPAEHPAPWRWDRPPRPDDDDEGTGPRELLDANGNDVMVSYDEWLKFASPLARELIRLAPEMAELLRRLEWAGDYSEGQAFCPHCQQNSHCYGKDQSEWKHEHGCPLGQILAALDAARMQ
jgi:hypothetical protein